MGFIFLLSAILLKEKIQPVVIIGTILIVIGIWILSRSHSTAGEKNIRLGVSVAVLAAFLYAFSIVATKTGLNEIDPFQSALISMPVPLALLYLYYSMNKGVNMTVILGTGATIAGILIIL